MNRATLIMWGAVALAVCALALLLYSEWLDRHDDDLFSEPFASDAPGGGDANAMSGEGEGTGDD